MKKILTASFLTMLMITAGTAQTSSPYKSVGAALPPMRIIDRNMKAHTPEEIKGTTHFFLVLFNPTCGHCIDMARMFGTHEQEFRNNTVMFMAAKDMMPYFDHFYKESGADDYKNLTIGVDSADMVNNLYKYGNLPQINIYDKDRKLVRIFSGETPLDSLLRYAN